MDHTPLKSGEADYGPSSTEGGERDGGRSAVEGRWALLSLCFFLIPSIINPASKRGM